jgi:hypothetical protein
LGREDAVSSFAPLIKRPIPPPAPAPAKRAAAPKRHPAPLPDHTGSPLPPVLRAEMTRRFGERFDDVRVHTGPEAAASTAAVGAAAYTLGSDVVFGAGRYAPAMESGRGLLAHELAHVVQQRRGAQSGAGAADAAAGEDSAGRAAAEFRTGAGPVRVAGASPAVLARQTPEQAAREERASRERQQRALDMLGPGLRATLEQAGIAPPRPGGPAPIIWLGEKPREELRQTAEQMAPIALDAVRSGRPVPQLRPPPPRPTGNPTRDLQNSLQQGFAAAGLAPLPGTEEQRPPIDPAVPGQARQVNELLEKWLTDREIGAVFRQADQRQFVELQDQVDMSKVLDKLDPWGIVQLGTYGPIVSSSARQRVNQTRADFLVDVTKRWGVGRAELFALYVFGNMTNDDVKSVLRRLAGDQELNETLDRMPHLTKLIADRQIDTREFKDRGWKAVDIATGFGGLLGRVAGSIPLVQEGQGAAAQQMAQDLPEPYRKAVQQSDMAAVMAALTPGNVAFGTADYALFGLLSGVKGVVYDAPKAVISGLGNIAEGHVATGVEQLTGGAIAIIGAVLGVRAFRKSARIAAMLELTQEGAALYDGLAASIGKKGIDKVAAYAQASAEAQILIRQEGAAGIEALNAAQGDVKAARAALASARTPPPAAGARPVLAAHGELPPPETDADGTSPPSHTGEPPAPSGPKFNPVAYGQTPEELGKTIGGHVIEAIRQGKLTGQKGPSWANRVVDAVRPLGLRPQDAATAIEAATKACGYDHGLRAQLADGTLVVTSARLGDNNFIVGILPDGTVKRGLATIDMGPHVPGGVSVANVKWSP